MMRRPLFLLALGLLLVGCGETAPSTPPAAAEAQRPRIVFVTGDEEYRSEESMPMLARLAARELDAEVEVLYALDSAGYIDPNEQFNIPGLAALDSADLAVFFLRYRQLPPEQARHITDYVESGRPIVGFRTSTHAFKYVEDSSRTYYNDDWPTAVFGQQWIVHHGHFDDGHAPLTAVMPDSAAAASPILRGVKPFDAYSWLYHVDGGNWQLRGDDLRILAHGRSLRSKQADSGKLAEYPLTNPVAWTKTYTGSSGRPSRVFFTTLGHPYDFTLPPMRKLALNGLAWALGYEDRIPDRGFAVRTVGPYEPSNSGFGDKYRAGVRPADVSLTVE